MKIPYSKAFFGKHPRTSAGSAEEIVPYIIELVAPKSVCDVGCGIGGWLEVFHRIGKVNDYLGFDGDYVPKNLMLIGQDKFITCNLAKEPVNTDRTFDLAVSLEVAEHIPADSAVSFVEALTKLAPVVLFSAAIKNQGGMHHINEQYPQYWAEIFARFGYVPIDCIRFRFWNNPKVACWYAQNSFLYVAKDRLSDYPKLPMPSELPVLPFVHPHLFDEYVWRATLLQRIKNKILRLLTFRQ